MEHDRNDPIYRTDTSAEALGNGAYRAEAAGEQVDHGHRDETAARNGGDASSTSPFGTPSRRAVVGAGAAVALGALAGGIGLGTYMANADPYVDSPHGRGDETDAYTADDVILSMCNNCNTYCTIKVRVADAAEGETAAEGASALVRKIAGNPYSPLNSQPYAPVPYATAPEEALAADGAMARLGRARNGGMICLKGQAGIQLAHDALRITQPLRRVGERGGNEWESVSWDTALDEIVNGSPALGTPGIASWWAYAPQEEVEADVARVEAGEMDKAAFAEKWTDALIDTDHPDLGPKSNLFCACGGDRMFLIGERFTQQGFGSVNQFNHGGVCGMTGVMGNARTHPTTGHKRMYADIDHCECLIIWGTEPMTANKGPTWLAPRLSVARQRGMKLIVVDPRQGKSAAKADTWLPVKPGFDTELAFALASWIVDNERYDTRYLSAPGKKAAETIGEPTWSDATHLVAVDKPGRPVVTAKLLGRTGEPGATGEALSDDARFVIVQGELAEADASSGAAELDVDRDIDTPDGPVHVKSVFTLLKERLAEHTLEEYAEAAGIDAGTVAEVAREFTSHGKRACVMSYRGPAMHANGFDAVRAIGYLNFLIGNHDWKGGHTASAAKFAPLTGRYDLASTPHAHKAWGIPITRQKTVYEKTSYFKQDGYPAKRPWYPLPGNLSHEIVPTLRAGYVYDHLGALFIHRHSLVDSTPGGERLADVLADTGKINLLVSFDVEVGDTSRFADFVLPDQTYLERFSQESIYPNQQYKLIQFGQPAIRAFEGPRSVEDVYIEVMKRLGLPGVGDEGVARGNADSGETAPLNNQYDYWLKMAANIAYAGEPVADADAEELALFERVRSRSLKGAFDIGTWKAAVSEEEWPKVVYVLNRGGRFASADPAKGDGYEGDLIAARYGGLCAFYDPKTASTKNALTGENFDGLAVAAEVAYADGTPVAHPEARPLALINWKARTNGTHRTIASPWLREVTTENFVWMAPADAEARGLVNGDAIEIEGPEGSFGGHVRVTEGIRPGVVGCNYSFGHTGYRAEPITVDGAVLEPAPDYLEESGILDGDVPGKQETGYAGGRGRGFRMNELLPDDPTIEGGGGLADPIGGGAAQLDLWVEIRKA